MSSLLFQVEHEKLVTSMLFISTSVWVLRTPNAAQNMHF